MDDRTTKERRVNIRLDDDSADLFQAYAEAIGSDPSALGRMLIHWHIGRAAAPPPRPANKITLDPRRLVNPACTRHALASGGDDE
jgi:hypothetical protein